MVLGSNRNLSPRANLLPTTVPDEVTFPIAPALEAGAPTAFVASAPAEPTAPAPPAETPPAEEPPAEAPPALSTAATSAKRASCTLCHTNVTT